MTAKPSSSSKAYVLQKLPALAAKLVYLSLQLLQLLQMSRLNACIWTSLNPRMPRSGPPEKHVYSLALSVNTIEAEIIT